METNDEDFFSRCSYWWSRTDFMRYPHVLHFESIPEMLDLVEGMVSSSLTVPGAVAAAAVTAALWASGGPVSLFATLC